MSLQILHLEHITYMGLRRPLNSKCHRLSENVSLTMVDHGQEMKTEVVWSVISSGRILRSSGIAQDDML